MLDGEKNVILNGKHKQNDDPYRYRVQSLEPLDKLWKIA